MKRKSPESRLASALPEPRGSGRVMNLNTLIVDCPIGEAEVCMSWVEPEGEPCQYFNGLCRLAHPETGLDDPERYTVGVDCLSDVPKAVRQSESG